MQPPLGLAPHPLWFEVNKKFLSPSNTQAKKILEKRKRDLQNTIERYRVAGATPNPAWVEELQETEKTLQLYF